MHKQNFFNEINLFGPERKIIFVWNGNAPEQPALQAGVEAQREHTEEWKEEQRGILKKIETDLTDMREKVVSYGEEDLPEDLKAQQELILEKIDALLEVVQICIRDINLLTEDTIELIRKLFPSTQETTSRFKKSAEVARKSAELTRRHAAISRYATMGWTKAERITDYDNVSIEEGLFGQNRRATEWGERNALATKHLYSGVLAGIRMSSGDDRNMNEFADKAQFEFENRDILKREYLANLVELEDKFERFKDTSPLFTMVQGYMLGLLYSAKKEWGEGEKFNKYADFLEKAKSEHRDEMVTAFMKAAKKGGLPDVEENEDLYACWRALESISQYLPLPEEWEAAPEGVQPVADEGTAGPNLSGLGAPEGLATGPAPVPGKAGGAEAGRPGPTGASSTGPREQGEWEEEKAITQATLKRNGKLMEKWMSKQGAKESIYATLNLDASTIKPGSEAFAKAVQQFQHDRGLDLHDGVIGDQTMTAIIGPDVANKGKFEEWGVEERKADFYIQKSGKKRKKKAEGETGRDKVERQEESADKKLGKKIGEILDPYKDKKEAEVKAAEGTIKETITQNAKEIYGGETKVSKVEITQFEVQDGKIKVTVKVTLKPEKDGEAAKTEEVKAEGICQKEEAAAQQEVRQEAAPFGRAELESTVRLFIGKAEEREYALLKETNKDPFCISSQLKARIIEILPKKIPYFDVNNATFKSRLDHCIDAAHSYLKANLYRQDTVISNEELTKQIVSRAESLIAYIEREVKGPK